ncbi:phosphoglycolate phosphatase [Jiella marina]|uniref:phosphoglycolate phosphatase n=1 Tax=Jiella sp. LLJ827 TaxID=2917712 RepID=UPI00210088F4|nr:phosphoglycolate phosphatase [Jiella sp. LLJ827]MCQ0990117.1 phosphoglycolate phosphatase [Jiella sp. LLJ827]
MVSPAWPKAVLFDLDGTLVHSAPDIHAALNQTLEGEGEPTFSLEAVTRMIGAGVPKLIERAYAALDKSLEPAELDRLVDRFLALYEPRSTELTRLFPGAAEIVGSLKAEGRRVGVVTNKPGQATAAILRHFGLVDHMDVVVGGDAGPPKKPEPGLLLHACETLGLSIGDVVFIGDSENDVAAAKAAEISVVVVTGGYTALSPEELGADAVIERLDEVRSTFDRLVPAGAGV